MFLGINHRSLLVVMTSRLPFYFYCYPPCTLSFFGTFDILPPESSVVDDVFGGIHLFFSSSFRDVQGQVEVVAFPCSVVSPSILEFRMFCSVVMMAFLFFCLPLAGCGCCRHHHGRPPPLPFRRHALLMFYCCCIVPLLVIHRPPAPLLGNSNCPSGVLVCSWCLHHEVVLLQWYVPVCRSQPLVIASCILGPPEDLAWTWSLGRVVMDYIGVPFGSQDFSVCLCMIEPTRVAFGPWLPIFLLAPGHTLLVFCL